MSKRRVTEQLVVVKKGLRLTTRLRWTCEIAVRLAGGGAGAVLGCTRVKVAVKSLVMFSFFFIVSFRR
jgi:hypothetical protein